MGKRMFKWVNLLFFLLCLSSSLSAQITVSLQDKTKTYEGNEYEARVDFISENENLRITEYAGNPVNAPQPTGDGRFIYTCICYVADENNLTFSVSEQGGVETTKQPVYIEEGQYFTYLVEVEGRKMSIEDIRLTEKSVVPISNTAKVFVSSEYDELSITSSTGEKVEGPVMTDNGVWRYTITYDMSSPESREIERSIKVAASKKDEPVEFLIGKLQPKSGRDVLVIVMEESCFDYNVRIAKKFHAECAYKEAFLAYKEAFQCETKPEDTKAEYQQMRLVNGLARLRIMEQEYWDRATNKNTPKDSVLYYYRKSKSYRKEILEHSPNDVICHAHNDAEKDLPRIVSGEVRNKAVLDASGKNMPIEGAFVTLCVHERKKDKETGYTYGKELVDKRQVFRTDRDGKYAIPVPKNTEEIVYVLRFTIGELKEGHSDPIVFMPTDADTQKLGPVLLTPDANFFGHGGVNNN